MPRFCEFRVVPLVPVPPESVTAPPPNSSLLLLPPLPVVVPVDGCAGSAGVTLFLEGVLLWVSLLPVDDKMVLVSWLVVDVASEVEGAGVLTGVA